MPRTWTEEQKREASERARAQHEQRQQQAQQPDVQPEPDAQEAAPKPLPRRKRKRLDGMNLKLSAPERPGFKRYWVNDDPDDAGGRLKYFQEDLAYDFVRNDDGTPKKRPVGGGITAYLMETPIEEYEAGQKDKQRQIDDMDRALQGGMTEDGTALKDQPGFYGEAKVAQEA